MNKVVILGKHGDWTGLTQVQAIKAANKMGIVLLPNKRFDKRLVLTDTWKGEREVYPAWTGTLVAYSKPGETNGKHITIKDNGITYVFEAPEQGKNLLFVVNHGFKQDGTPLIIPHETKDGKGNVTEVSYEITDMNAMSVLQMPAEEGWYVAEEKFGIPAGAPVDYPNNGARRLKRTYEYVGLLARATSGLGICYDYDSRQTIYANVRSSSRFGALVYADGTLCLLRIALQQCFSYAEKALQRLAAAVNEKLFKR